MAKTGKRKRDSVYEKQMDIWLQLEVLHVRDLEIEARHAVCTLHHARQIALLTRRRVCLEATQVIRVLKRYNGYRAEHDLPEMDWQTYYKVTTEGT